MHLIFFFFFTNCGLLRFYLVRFSCSVRSPTRGRPPLPPLCIYSFQAEYESLNPAEPVTRGVHNGHRISSPIQEDDPADFPWLSLHLRRLRCGCERRGALPLRPLGSAPRPLGSAPRPVGASPPVPHPSMTTFWGLVLGQSELLPGKFKTEKGSSLSPISHTVHQRS